MATPTAAPTGTAAARRRFDEAAERFRSARADAWAEWAGSRVERLVVEQFAVTAALGDDVLHRLKRTSGMAIVGRAARMSAEPLPALDGARWEAASAFDAREARAEVDARPADLPDELLDALAGLGYDTAEAPAWPRGRSAAQRAAEQAASALVAAAADLVAAAATERAEEQERSRAAARRRWASA